MFATRCRRLSLWRCVLEGLFGQEPFGRTKFQRDPFGRGLAIEVLKSRRLLSLTFANLPYTDPFPAAAQLGQPSQPSEQCALYRLVRGPSGGNLYGRRARGCTTTTGMSHIDCDANFAQFDGQSGLSQMSVEFWLNVPAGSDIGNGIS